MIENLPEMISIYRIRKRTKIIVGNIPNISGKKNSKIRISENAKREKKEENKNKAKKDHLFYF